MTPAQSQIDDRPDPRQRLEDHFKVYLAQRLSGFTAGLRAELDAGQDLPHLATDAALLLSNLCDYLALTHDQRVQVLGPLAAAYVARLEGDDLESEASADQPGEDGRP